LGVINDNSAKNELVFLLQRACRLGAKGNFITDIVLPMSAMKHCLDIAFVVQSERSMGLSASDTSPFD